MHTHRPWLWLAIGSATALAVASAAGAGLGSGGSSAVLGQPLDFAVQVRLEPGDSLTPECVTAEVMTGDRRVPPGLVRTLLEITGPESIRVRVQTQTVMDEPVIGIQLSVGCTARMTRRYVVLADPPYSAAVVTAPAFAANPSSVPDAPAVASSSASTPLFAPTEARAANASGQQAGSVSGVAGVAAAAPRQPRSRAEPRAERRTAATGAAVRPRAQRRESNRVAPRAATAPKVLAAAKPEAPARLTLEPAEAPVRSHEAVAAAAVEEALAAVAQAASSARAAASAASASAARMAALERTVEQLRTEAKTSRDANSGTQQVLKCNASCLHNVDFPVDSGPIKATLKILCSTV